MSVWCWPTFEACDLLRDDAGEGEADAVTDLHACGAIVVRSAVPLTECAAALCEVNVRLERALAESGQSSTADDPGAWSDAGSADDHDGDSRHSAATARYFGNVASPSHRRDLKLALTSDVKSCLDRLLVVLRPTLSGVLTDDAELCELSALCSDPGAAAQTLHPDTQISGAHSHCSLLTAFLALQDVTPEMGPTEVVPGSNTAAAHAALASGNKQNLQGGGEAALVAGGWLPPQYAALRAGDVLLMDSRAVHRGAANLRMRRVLLYVSFQVPNNAPPGSTYSLLDEYRGRFRLRSHVQWRDPNAEES